MNLQITPEVRPEGKREDWLDIGKFLAAILIVCWHVPNYTVKSLSASLTVYSNVAFFMILSGYFIGKNVAWNKCLSRFISLLIPFLIWNFIVSFEYAEVPYLNVSEFLCRLVGYQSLFIPGFNPLGVDVGIGQPFSTPTWFLRDLLLCFLLTPLLFKCRMFLIPLIVLAFCMEWPVTVNSINSTLSPFVVAEFSLGLLLSRFDIKKVKYFFEKNERLISGVLILLAGAFFLIGVNNYLASVQSQPDWPIFLRLSSFGLFDVKWHMVEQTYPVLLVGSFLILFAGFLLDKYCNRQAWLTNVSRASFLIFILHYPLYNLIPVQIFKASLFSCFLGIALVIGVIIGFYLLLNRYLPCLLPYLANVHSPIKK